jgi:hypothetical protein
LQIPEHRKASSTKKSETNPSPKPTTTKNRRAAAKVQELKGLHTAAQKGLQLQTHENHARNWTPGTSD